SNGERYDVRIEPQDAGLVQSQCTCESWNKYGPHCKHVVAAALVYLARLRAAEPKSPPPPTAAANDLPPAPASSEEAVSLPALAKLENWLGLSALPDFEYLYRLSAVPQGAGARHWVMDVRRLDAQGKGPVHVKRTLSAGTRIAPADERVFLQLARHEARYDGRLVLSDEDFADVLELLRARRVLYRGTGLQFSAEPARPTVCLENRDDGAMARLELSMPDGSAVSLKDAVVLSGIRTWVLV